MKRAAGDPILVVKRSHAFFALPRFRGSNPVYRCSVHWLNLYVGVYRSMQSYYDQTTQD